MPATSVARGVDTAIAGLAEFVVASMSRPLPAEVAAAAERILGNGLAASLAGHAHPTAQDLSDWLTPDPASPGQCRVMWGRRTDAGTAALINCVLWEAWSWSEAYGPTYIHPAGAAWAGALAAGDLLGSTGRRVLDGYAVGAEVALAVSHRLMPELYARGFAPVPIHASIAAAAGYAAVAGYSADDVANAIGTAMALAGGVFESVGSPANLFAIGWATRAGVSAAQSVAHGITSASTVFEGPRGLRAALTGLGPVDGPMFPDLGAPWRLGDLTLLNYPAESVTQAGIEAAALLAARASDKQRKSAVHLTVTVDEHTAQVADQRWRDRPTIVSDLEAKGDLRLCIALTWLHGEYALEQRRPTAYLDDTARDWRGRVEVRADDSMNSGGAHVRVEFADGSEDAVQVALAAGYPGRPLSAADIERKFSEAVRFVGRHPAGDLSVARFLARLQGQSPSQEPELTLLDHAALVVGES
jgi:2-methylcitrate dehydratase PrpD